MKYREFEVQMPGKTAKLGILGETHMYSPQESDCADKIVPQFNAVAIEGSDNFTRVHMAMLPFIPAMIAIAGASHRSFERTAKTIAEGQEKKIVRLEPNMGESFSYKQLLALAAVGLMSIPFIPFIYTYLRNSGDDILSSEESDDNQDVGRFSRLRRFIKFAIEGNIAERDRKMAQRTKDVVLSGVGDVLHVSGMAHTEGVVANLMALQGADFRIHEVATPSVYPVCNFLPRSQEVTNLIQPNSSPQPIPVAA